MPDKDKKSPEETISSTEMKEKAIDPVATAPEAAREVAEPNEAFFGTVLIGCLALSLIAAAGYFGFSGYRYFKAMNDEQAAPSIAVLPVVEKKETPVEAAAEEKKETETPTPETLAADKKTLEVKVLNGGAAKGVAGAYAEKLKKEGFTKTAVGNTFGSYTGAALYYAKGQESGLAALKETVIKDYPKLITKEAEAGNKDTTAAPLTLILGQ